MSIGLERMGSGAICLESRGESTLRLIILLNLILGEEEVASEEGGEGHQTSQGIREEVGEVVKETSFGESRVAL